MRSLLLSLWSKWPDRGTEPAPLRLRRRRGQWSFWLLLLLMGIDTATTTDGPTAHEEEKKKKHPEQDSPSSRQQSFNSSKPPPLDTEAQWFRQRGWNYYCLDMEFICRDPSGDAWWYDPHVPTINTTTTTTTTLHQPEVHVALQQPHYSCPDLERDILHVKPPNAAARLTTTSPPVCDYARLPTHLVLYSLYNDMLGEFYSRQVAGLHLAYERQNVTALSKSRTQLYLHLYDDFLKHTTKRPSLLESHHAFTAGLRQGVPLLNARNHLWYPEPSVGGSCTCYRQLVLCGYQHDRKKRNIDNATTTTKPSDFFRSWRGIGLLPSSLVKSGLAKSVGEVYQISHRLLRRHVIEENPWAVQNLHHYRRQLLQSILIPHYMQGQADNNRSTHLKLQIQTTVDNILQHADEWKIVGLTQRSKRRRWANVEEIQNACHERLIQYRVICVVVNVEQVEYTPRRHVLIHSALDALLGIHGAQLTEALWMKPGSLVIEFNPFLPKSVKQGSWTRTATRPTPLGEIFLDTELFHIGLPLLRESLTVCREFNGTDAIECIRHNRWDDRDFLAPVNETLYALETLLAQPRPVLCNSLQNVSNGSWILYNVQCADPSETNHNKNNINNSTNATSAELVPRTRHFYWKNDLGQLPEYRSVDPGKLI